MAIGPVWVVQDTDSGDFLYPHPDGDVGFTKLLKHAGRFEDPESAMDTAAIVLGHDFSVSMFYEDRKK